MDIFFYQKPKISIDDSHKIDFLNESDKYNPYSIKNKYGFCRLKLDKQIIDFIIEDFLKIDIYFDMVYNIKELNVYSNKNFLYYLIYILNKSINKKSLKIYNQFFFKLMINEKNIKSMILGTILVPKICGELMTNPNSWHIIVNRFIDRRKTIQYVY